MAKTTTLNAAQKAWITRRAKAAKPASKTLPPAFSAASTVQIKDLEKTVNSLKVVVAQLLTQSPTKGKALSASGVSAKVDNKPDPLQTQARRQVRDLVQNYASKRADELKITGENRRIFFDLSFKALYNNYKDTTPNKVDLKVLADKETALTGTKVSGLQVAEKLGLAIDLLTFAKAFYNLN